MSNKRRPSREALKYKRIGVDIDQVVCNSEEQVISELKRRFPKLKFSPEVITDWDWIQKTPLLDFLTAQERKELDWGLWNDPSLLLASEPYQDALPILKSLANAGAELSFVTSREPHLFEITHQWFDQWLPWVGPEQIFIRPKIQNPQMDRVEFKKKIAVEREFSVFIEDDPKAAILLSGISSLQVFLMQARANVSLRKRLEKKPNDGIKIVEDWDQIQREILA